MLLNEDQKSARRGGVWFGLGAKRSPRKAGPFGGSGRQAEFMGKYCVLGVVLGVVYRLFCR